MGTNFPTSLDVLVNPTASDPTTSPSHASQHDTLNDAVEALEAKVGVDSSAATTSHDYKIRNNLTIATNYTDAAITALLAGTEDLSAALTQAVNAQTGTTYTIAATDLAKLVTQSNAGNITTTAPQDSDVTWAIGAWCDLFALGTGQITVVAGTGATLRSTPTAKSRAQYSRLRLQKIAANTWQLSGDLAPARHATRVYRAALQSVSTSTLTTISWDTERFDDDGLWAIGTPTDFVIPFAGLYVFGACIGLEATDTDRSLQGDIYNNTTSTVLTELGGSGFAKSLSTNDNPNVSSETLAPCAAGDHIRVRVYQASGSTLNTGASSATAWNSADFWAYLVTPA